MGLKIRKATMDDIQLLINAKSKVIRDHYSFLSGEEQDQWVEHSANETYFEKLLSRKDTFVIVASEIVDSQEKILGLCSITKIEDAAERWADVANLFSVGEIKGVGKAMLGAAIATSENWKLSEMRVPVFVEDGPTLAFFQRWDFFPSHHTQHPQLPGRSVLYLKRPLRTKPRDPEEDSLYQKR